ncbi:hypothetical protein [Promicromonospora panici]|uniref:hypothetical protein n=1 Tax=Promicromonospora panici TaxID=2219658 RepID=UPI00101DEEBF|nr:hypothetical protein [Promicromonospora panici]
MRLMITFRSLLAARRRDPARVLVIMMLVVGVMLVHATSTATNAHSAPVVAVADHHLTPGEGDAHAHGGVPAAEHTEHGDVPAGGDHHNTAALCLMALVALLALTVPDRLGAMRLRPVWALATRWAPPARTAATAPSLHALGISRT